MLDIPVGLMADDQGLALAGRHQTDPLSLGALPFALEVLQGSNVMHLDLLLRAAELAGSRRGKVREVPYWCSRRVGVRR